MGVGIAAVALAGTAAFVGLSGNDAPRRVTLSTQLTPTATPTPEPTAVPSATASPTASPTRPPRHAPLPVAAETSAVPRPTKSAAPIDAAPDHGSEPVTHTFDYDPGRTTYSFTDEGIALTATFSAMQAKTGQEIAIDITGRGGAKECCHIGVYYGDGGSDDKQFPGDCLTEPKDLRTQSLHVTHPWNRAKRWLMQIQTGEAGCESGPDQKSLVIQVYLDITPGTYSSNGPLKATIAFDESTPPQPGDPSYASYYGDVSEKDGYLTELVLDYGDGTSPKVFPGDPEPCREGAGGQPLTSHARLPSNPPASHHYDAAGTYTWKLTAYSAGCGGKDIQTTVATYTYTA